jgi:DNA-binding transcriptional MocR family regulator
VSVPTVKQAYLELERQGAIAARPQSGYYLKAENVKPLRSTRTQWRKTEPTPVKCRSLIERVYDEVHKPGIVPLGITNGAQEAMSIALQCVAKAGDVIAVESPTFFGVLELSEALNMKALEIRTYSENGICLDDLSQAIELHPIKACIFASSINNPMGSLIPEAKREKMVRLLEENPSLLTAKECLALWPNNSPQTLVYAPHKAAVFCG